jgi:CRISPR/Cas system CSM-associated protein Csm3 (group 7 of RAMP superfamily)
VLKALVNRCDIAFSFTNTSPMLVKDGRHKQQPAIFQCRDSDRDMLAKVSAKNWRALRFFIPASSMRGVFRSHMERIARSFSPEQPIVCNPFVEPQEPGAKEQHAETGCGYRAEGYADSCPICRLFGSTKHAGRIQFQDGNVTRPGNCVVTDQIAIDRFTGSAKDGALFQKVLLDNYTFATTIQVRNFELWQLGLLGYAFKDLKHGKIQIGAGKNLEHGYIKCDTASVKISVTYYGALANIPQDGSVQGLYERPVCGAEGYRFVPRPDKKGVPGLLLVPPNLDANEFEFAFEAENSEQFWRALAPTWNDALVQAEIFPSRVQTIAPSPGAQQTPAGGQ